MPAKDKLIVALDVDVAEAKRLVEQLKDVVGMFKVGSQLFTKTGPDLVRTIIAHGNKVFLDLKFHDIPHQVAGSSKSAAELGVSLFTLHASGGTEMMRRAVDAVLEVSTRTGRERSKILAVSVLTSIDDSTLAEIGVAGSSADTVQRLVTLAQEAGVDGCVSSPQETANIKATTRSGFLVVNPGIRPASGPKTGTNDDQKRIDTPGSAILAGADYLVVGRPITSAADPVESARQIVAEIDSALQSKSEQAMRSNV